MTKENINLPKRCHPAHPPPLHKHNRPVIIFLTVCISPRRSILDNEDVHKALRHIWKQADEWTVGYYLIMPDHIHLFCSPANDGDTDLKKWVIFWKRLASKGYPVVAGMWQNDYWDTQIRSSEHWLQKTEYVRNNPVRCGLVENSEEWPYQGVMSELWW
jgi:putative transposase